MATVLGSIARVAPRITLLSLLAVVSFKAPAAAPTTDPPTGSAIAHNYYPEVRLRKLHLVRPDLIPYPIDYEVYC